MGAPNHARGLKLVTGAEETAVFGNTFVGEIARQLLPGARAPIVCLHYNYIRSRAAHARTHVFAR